jgi:hypothetical protein
MLLPPLFFPPILWFEKVKHLSVNGALVKQSLMNRCWIKSPGQPLALIVPVEHIGRPRSFEETRVVYRENWPIRMERSIETYYRKSAYFEHYFPEIQKLLNNRYELLSDLNMATVRLLYQAIHRPFPEIRQEPFQFFETDFPPKPSAFVSVENERFQLYGNFVSGLSSLDILFHYGYISQD